MGGWVGWVGGLVWSTNLTVIHSHMGDTRKLTAAPNPNPLQRTPAPIATTVGTTKTDIASLYWAT